MLKTFSGALANEEVRLTMFMNRWLLKNGVVRSTAKRGGMGR